MVAFLTLPKHTNGAEICKAVINEFCSCQIEVSKVVPGTLMVPPA